MNFSQFNRSYFIYYGKSWNGKNFSFANVKKILPIHEEFFAIWMPSGNVYLHIKARQTWHFSHLQMDIFCHFNFYHNRWNSSCTIQYYYYSVFNNNVVVCMLKGLFILQVDKYFHGFCTSLMKTIPIYCLLNWISFIIVYSC